MEVLSISEIRAQYPNEWVLVGNPELDDPNTLGSIVSKMVRGIVLFSSKDKRELAYRAKDFTAQVNRTACIYTGEIPQNRIFLL